MKKEAESEWHRTDETLALEINVDENTQVRIYARETKTLGIQTRAEIWRRETE